MIVNPDSYFEQSIADFDLSIFESASEYPQENEVENASVVLNSFPFTSKGDSLSARVSHLEELLGIYHLTFWGVYFENTIETLTFICRTIFGWPVTADDFVVIHRLDDKRSGALLRVS